MQCIFPRLDVTIWRTLHVHRTLSSTIVSTVNNKHSSTERGVCEFYRQMHNICGKASTWYGLGDRHCLMLLQRWPFFNVTSLNSFSNAQNVRYIHSEDNSFDAGTPSRPSRSDIEQSVIHISFRDFV